MTAYLYDCACGHRMEVDSSRAGESTECPECGAEFQLPSLRAMKQLPPAESAAPSAAAAPTKSLADVASQEHSTLIRNVGLLLILLSVMMMAVLIYVRVTAIAGLSRQTFIDDSEVVIERMTPLETWLLWKDYQEMGMGPQEITMLKAERRRLQVIHVLMALDGAVALVGLWMVVSGGRARSKRGP